MTLIEKVYKFVFWIGYFIVLITAFLPITGELNKIYLGSVSLHIRLDHFLHFIVYFLICMYYCIGLVKGLSLFTSGTLLKFIVSVISLATVTEVVQIWVPERAFNPMDWVANVAGIFIGVIVIISYIKIDALRKEL
jgi:VanZ family protein